MLLDTFVSSEDGLLDALLDHLTIDPAVDLSSVLAEVDQLRAAHTTGAKMEQHQAEQQQQRGADLQKRWSAITEAALPNQSEVGALVSDTVQCFASLRSSVERAKASRSGGWRASTTTASSSVAPTLVITSILPLLTCLTQAATTDVQRTEDDAQSATEALRVLRPAYLRVLPNALRTAKSAAASAPLLDLSHRPSEATVVVWYSQCTSDPVLHQLLSPYLCSTVEPLERELRYHFSAGRATAPLHEPQHFFSFLSECFERQHHTHQRTWAHNSATQTTSSPVLCLLQLLDRMGQLALSAAAVVAFQSCYGWHPHSPLWGCTEYVVVTVNAALDFVAHAEGRVSREALELLVGHLLVEEVVQSYARAGVDMAEAALRSGTARLWRRSFLTHNSPQATFPLYTCSLHMVRALEAFLRRLLSTLCVVEGRYAAVMWRRTVEPALSLYLEVVEAQDPSTGGAHGGAVPAWDTVLALQWCVASVQVVAAAAEDWLGMLRDSISTSSGPTLHDHNSASGRPLDGLTTSDALDGLALFRDTLVRRAAEQAKALTRQLCSLKSGDAAQAAAVLQGLDAFLQLMEALPEGSSRYVLHAVIQGTVQESLPQEQRDGLAEFASRSGLLNVLHLLTS